MHIKDTMNHPVITCPLEANLDAVARLMWEFDCGVIPVVDTDGRLAGIVTDRDISMAAYTQGRLLSEIAVTTAMSRDVFCAHPDDTIEVVEHVMRDNQVRRVPVVDGDHRPVGIVSMNDLSRLAAKAHRSGVDREFVRTMAAICQPRAHDQSLQSHDIVRSVA